MADLSRRITRREFVAGAIVLPALAGAILSATTAAQAKGSQAQFKYQDKPNNGHKCSACSFFIPGKPTTRDGTCKIVEGGISPNGWCTAFAPKS